MQAPLSIFVVLVQTPEDELHLFFFFLINCWSSVVASVVLPQLCNLHCVFFFFVDKTLEQRRMRYKKKTSLSCCLTNIQQLGQRVGHLTSYGRCCQSTEMYLNFMTKKRGGFCKMNLSLIFKKKIHQFFDKLPVKFCYNCVAKKLPHSDI